MFPPNPDRATIEAQASLYIYAVTIRKNKNSENSKEVLDNELKAVCKKFSAVCTHKVYEYGKSDIVHIHGIISTNYHIERVDRIKRRGWSNDLRPIYNVKGWERYIGKEQNTKGQEDGKCQIKVWSDEELKNCIYPYKQFDSVMSELKSRLFSPLV